MGTREQRSKQMNETGEQRQFWGPGNRENQDFNFEELRKSNLFQRNKGTSDPLGGPRSSCFISVLNPDFAYVQ